MRTYSQIVKGERNNQTHQIYYVAHEPLIKPLVEMQDAISIMKSAGSIC